MDQGQWGQRAWHLPAQGCSLCHGWLVVQSVCPRCAGTGMHNGQKCTYVSLGLNALRAARQERLGGISQVSFMGVMVQGDTGVDDSFYCNGGNLYGADGKALTYRCPNCRH